MNAPSAISLEGLRVFVVEDESLVAMLVEDMLTGLGCTVVDLAGTIAQALERLQVVAGQTDAAILDVNIGGEKVYPVADALAALDIPFLFASGYGPASLGDRYPTRTVLSKPFTEAALAHALATVRSAAT